jgi:hypothetical protein
MKLDTNRIIQEKSYEIALHLDLTKVIWVKCKYEKSGAALKIKNQHIKKIQPTIQILILITLVVIAAIITFKLTRTTLLLRKYFPASDYFSLVERYIQFSQQQLSLVELVFQKQADHNHALTFLVGFLDLKFFHGSMILLNLGIVVSVFSLFFFILYLILQEKDLFNLRLLFFLLFVISQLLTPYGFELWQYPFQFVQVSTRAFVIIGLYFYVKGLLEQNQFAYYFGNILLLIATISHGSGNLVPIFQLLIICITHTKGVSLHFSKFFPIVGNFFVLFLLNSKFPPQTQPFAMIRGIDLTQWLNLPRITSKLLGQTLFWGIDGVLATSIGFLTVLGLFVYMLKMMRNRLYSVYSLTFSICSLFFLTSVSNSVLVNFYYQQVRGIQSPTDLYFWASRYQAMTAGFWISISFLIFLHVRSAPKSISKILILILPIITFFSVTTSIDDELLEKSVSRNSLDISNARYIANPDNSKYISDQFLTSTFSVPDSWSFTIRGYFEFLKSNRLGLWSNPKELTRYTGIVDLTDSNWLNGKSRFDSRFLFFNTPLNIQKLNQSGFFNHLEDIYAVEAITEHEMYLHVNAQRVHSESSSPFTPADLTDDNWWNGVSRSEAAFFIPVNNKNVGMYKPGAKIKFGSGLRTVLRTTVSGSWLNVYLDGPTLNPFIDGYPNMFELIE